MIRYTCYPHYNIHGPVTRTCLADSSWSEKAPECLSESIEHSLIKQPRFRDTTTDFPAKWRLRNDRRNSILMTSHYPVLGSAFKVAEHSFGSLWVYSFAKSWQEERCSSQAETWQVKNILIKDFDWQVKVDVFVVSMATWTIECNLKIPLLLSLHKIRSIDFPLNLHTAYYC